MDWAGPKMFSVNGSKFPGAGLGKTFFLCVGLGRGKNLLPTQTTQGRPNANYDRHDFFLQHLFLPTNSKKMAYFLTDNYFLTSNYFLTGQKNNDSYFLRK